MRDSATTLSEVSEFFPNIGAALSRPEPKPRWPIAKEPPENAATIESIGIDAVAPWLSSCLEKLRQCRSISDDWESSGAMPPNDVAIALATKVLMKLAQSELTPDHIEPSTGEGVCISFERSGLYADIECFNADLMLASTIRYGDKPISIIWEVSSSSIEDSISKILNFFSTAKS